MPAKYPSGIGKMTATIGKVLDEARLCIATAAGDRGWDDTRQSWLARAARRLGLTYSRAHHIWYGRARLYADELEDMRAKITELRWCQRRHEDRHNEVGNAIQALVSGNTPPLERETERLGSERPAAAGSAVARPDTEA